MTEPLTVPRGLRVLQALLRFLLRLMMRLDVQGLEYLPEHGPAILTTNHVSWLDVPLIGAFCKAPAATFAADKWDGFPVIGWALAYYGQAIWVRRGEIDRKALTAAIHFLRKGGVLGLAPEGTRSHDGILRQAHDGIVWLAARTDAQIVPVALWGHEDVTGHWRRLRRPLVHLHVGEPFYLPPAAREARSRDLEAYTDMIMRRIAALLPPDRRGYYA